MDFRLHGKSVIIAAQLVILTGPVVSDGSANRAPLFVQDSLCERTIDEAL